MADHNRNTVTHVGIALDKKLDVAETAIDHRAGNSHWHDILALMGGRPRVQ